MEFEKLIGKNFNDVKLHSFTIENNDFELELEEGIDEEFYVTDNDRSFQMILDKKKIIQTIFFYPAKDGSFVLKGYSTKMGRKEIRDKWGQPDHVGEPFDNFLGKSGGFDRYVRDLEYQFQYADDDQKKLQRITISRKS